MYILVFFPIKLILILKKSSLVFSYKLVILKIPFYGILNVTRTN